MAAIGAQLGLASITLAFLSGMFGILAAATTSGEPAYKGTDNAGPPVSHGAAHSGPVRLSPIFALDAGLAGPPLVAKDGTWWLSGRDGQLARFGPNDSLQWEIGLGASVLGEATLADEGLLFIPTVKNSIVAMQGHGVSRWRSRAPWGIDGPLAWVPTQGLVFVSDDQYVQWLGVNARLLQRSKLPARRSAGPLAIGNAVVLGTESGALMVWDTLSQHVQLQLPHRVRAVIGASQLGFLALSGADAYWIVESSVRRQLDRVVAAGVVMVEGKQQSQNLAVVAHPSGKLEWLDAQGQTAGSCDLPLSASVDLVPEIAASPHCAWASSMLGELWQCCTDGTVRSFPLSDAPLLRPVFDWSHRRLLVGSSRREVWAIPMPPKAVD